MNEALIKELIGLKLKAADAVLDTLPPRASEHIRNVGRIILEGLNEGCSKTVEKSEPKTGDSGKLKNVSIE